MNALSEADTFRALANRLAWALEDLEWQEVGRIREEAAALGIDAEALDRAARAEAG